MDYLLKQHPNYAKNMKRHLIWIFLLLPLAALADGEQRDIKGATWVKPAEYLEINKVKRNNAIAFENPSIYVFGSFDINELAKSKDVQIVGMKLRPKFTRVDSENLIGVKIEDKQVEGRINSESFCIYTDRSITRNYKVDYKYDDGYVHSFSVIKDLRLVQTDKGLGLHYGWNCTYTLEGEAGHDIVSLSPDSDEVKSIRYPFHFEGSISKPAKVEMAPVASFYSSKSSNCVSLVLFMTEAKKECYFIDPDGLEHKWNVRPFIIFEVEEILVAEPGTVKTESIKPTSSHDGQGGVTQLLDDLLAWIRGEGDPLGLGEHTDATESAVVGAIGTLMALLLGGLAGGAGGTIPLVPPVSSTVPPTAPASPVDPTKFTPTNYPDYCEQFITQQPDGDVVMRSPATGQSVHYYSNGDGTWFSDSGMTYTAEDIEERLRREAENAGYVRQNAETAARNVEEQRAAWEAQNARDRERGYSDEMKEYKDWKQAQENQLKHEEFLEKMALKYHVPPTDKAVKDAIKFEQTMNQIDANTYLAEAEAIGKSIEYLEKVEKTADVAVNVMAAAVPGGTVVKNYYTFAKSTLVATSESMTKGKGFGVTDVFMGVGDGLLGVIQNEAGNLTGNGKFALLKEWGINVMTEDLKEGMKVIADSKTWENGDWLDGLDKVGKTMIATTGKKTAEFGVGKLISGGLGFLKDTAKASLDPTDVDVDKFYFSEGTAKQIDKWLNQTHKVEFSSKVKTINLSFSGEIDTGGLTEGAIGEVLSRNEAYDWGGDVANWVNDRVADGVGNVMYGLDVAGGALVDFANRYGSFNALAASCGKS